MKRKQFFAILNFEFSNYAKSKPFIIMTVAVIAIIGVVLFFPRMQDLITGRSSGASDGKAGTETSGSSEKEKDTVLLADRTTDNSKDTLIFFTSMITGYNFVVSNSSDDEIRAAIENGKAAFAVIIDTPLSYRFIAKNLGMYDTLPSLLDEAIRTRYRLLTLEKLGIPDSKAASIAVAPVKSKIIEVGKNQTKSFIYTYILIFALYIAIMLYGQFVAASVASEKNSRAMELLVTSVRPVNLMFGKVLGSGLAGLLQFSLIFGSAFLFYNINSAYFKGVFLVSSLFGMPASALVFAGLFFVLGYLLYSFMYGAMGSLASRTEDINTSILPVTFIFIAAFMVTMFSMSGDSVNSSLMIFCSYLPFTAPMAMFARICMSAPAAWEIALSIAILIGSIIGIGYLAAGIYRMGVLMYGKPPRLREVLHLLKTH